MPLIPKFRKDVGWLTYVTSYSLPRPVAPTAE